MASCEWTNLNSFLAAPLITFPNDGGNTSISYILHCQMCVKRGASSCLLFLDLIKTCPQYVLYVRHSTLWRRYRAAAAGPAGGGKVHLFPHTLIFSHL